VSRDWILSVAKDPSEKLQQRRRAISMADRLGMTAGDLANLYDGMEEGDVRSSIISALASNGTRVATDKLISIAKIDPLLANRKRAIQALGKFDDPKIKEALRDLVGK
jgi:HEAT repeat protein